MDIHFLFTTLTFLICPVSEYMIYIISQFNFFNFYIFYFKSKCDKINQMMGMEVTDTIENNIEVNI